MSTPIYKLWFGRPTDAWYQLSKEEQQQILTQVSEGLSTAGCESLITCESGWATDQWHYWGVEKYSSLEVLQKYTHFLNDINWPRYMEATSILGTAMPG